MKLPGLVGFGVPLIHFYWKYFLFAEHCSSGAGSWLFGVGIGMNSRQIDFSNSSKSHDMLFADMCFFVDESREETK